MPWERLENEQDVFMLQHRTPVFIGAAVLAALAGYINVVMLGFFAVPVSHMSGAVAHLGVDIMGGNTADLLPIGSILVGFWLGAFSAGLLISHVSLRLSKSYVSALALEALLLCLAAFFALNDNNYAVALAAAACGLQNAMAGSFRGLTIRTTHVTGVVTDLGALLGSRLRGRKVKTWKLVLLLIILLAFFTGGILGAFAVYAAGLVVLLPAALVAALLAMVAGFIPGKEK